MQTRSDHEFTHDDRIDTVNDKTLLLTWSALGQVYDPELGIDIVSLGLIYDVRRSGNTVFVVMTLTTPGCPASENLPDMAESAVKGVLDNDLSLDLQVVWDPPWNPSMMNDKAAALLGF